MSRRAGSHSEMSILLLRQQGGSLDSGKAASCYEVEATDSTLSSSARRTRELGGFECPHCKPSLLLGIFLLRPINIREERGRRGCRVTQILA